jgi:hypothetical protein
MSYLNILVTLLKADVSEKSAQCSHPTAELGKLQWIGRLYNRRKSIYDSLILTKALHFVWHMPHGLSVVKQATASI